MGGATSSFTNQHVVITGGSQGFGLAIAQEFAKDGARVTIISRDQAKLDDAKALIDQKETGYVQALACDVTDRIAIRKTIKEAANKFGPVDVLVTSAGFAPTGYFREFKDDAFRQAMDLNYYGTLNAVRAVTPSMQDRRKGRIVLVSSGLALTGYIGYSAYCPSKWAVRGLGEALRSELLPYDIRVQQVYPPGMDTPGFLIENQTKPEETKAIEAGEVTHQPEKCAVAAYKEICRGNYHITCGDFNLGMLARAAAGMSPRNSMLMDMVLMPVLVLIGKFTTWGWDSEVRKAKYKRER
mmetsp:Transcript_36323/g.65033  ORF Transcript_36323/g.65033 Transcript_36323/m.65033 type:complete len:297 (-) Transcript_36323:680-1570(-)